MDSNLDRYRKDLDALITKGDLLALSMRFDCHPLELTKALEGKLPEDEARIRKALPDFTGEYEPWYSEAKALVRQLLPDRLNDFVRHYEAPKSRKEISYETYRIEDYFLGLAVTRPSGDRVVGPDAAIPHFRQQVAIVKSVRARFESSLFEIRQLVQADLFDSELAAARELAKKRFTRAAGAVAGVVLERHLRQVCDNHQINVTKKHPNIADLNDLLKAQDAIDVPTWRFVQHLADIRNTCDHSKSADPTAEQVDDLVTGVTKLTKTLF